MQNNEQGEWILPTQPGFHHPVVETSQQAYDP